MKKILYLNFFIMNDGNSNFLQYCEMTITINVL